MSQLAIAISKGYVGSADEQEEQAAAALDDTFVTRYPQRFRSARRTVFTSNESTPAFAGLLHPDSPSSGAYGGMSLIWFPVAALDGEPSCSLLTFVCGTRGLSPDEQIMGRPGHIRHLRALARHLGQSFKQYVWVKRDPTNLSQPMPQSVATEAFSRFNDVISRYGNVIYAATVVPSDPAKAEPIVMAFLDYYAWERGWEPRSSARPEIDRLRISLRKRVFPSIEIGDLHRLIRERRFVILQGPPGTGKTRLSLQLYREKFGESGSVIQFHTAVTYESFVAGLSPDVSDKNLRFVVKNGALVDAVEAAASKDYLLVIDEVNRADLSKVLGEAIYLFEADDISANRPRSVTLPHSGKLLSIPKGLFVLGTMNSADRSIAILDLAVRRRFAFVDVWPSMSAVEESGRVLAIEAFSKLQDIFAEFATDDALSLMPGHAYFLGASDDQIKRRLKYEVAPLIREYLAEGRLSSCEGELFAYIDWIDSITGKHE